jgi:hypothetical protein
VDGGAVYCAGGTAGIVQNVFESNRANEGGAIRYSGSGSITFNTFRGNGRIAGVPGKIALVDGTEPPVPQVEVSGNLFHDGTSGVLVTTAPSTIVSYNTPIRGEVGIVGVNTGDAVTSEQHHREPQRCGIAWSTVSADRPLQRRGERHRSRGPDPMGTGGKSPSIRSTAIPPPTTSAWPRIRPAPLPTGAAS